MANQPADQVFAKSARSRAREASGEHSRRRAAARPRMPSSTGYMFGAIAIAVALFFTLWWMLVSGGDEAPWVPAGLAASVVLLVFFSAREVVMRRAWTRYLLENDQNERAGRSGTTSRPAPKDMRSSSLHSAALRNLQKQSADADSSVAPIEAHLELFHLCRDYLSNTDEALRSHSLSTEGRLSLRSGQERVRELQKHHMLTWARDGARALTREAQQRARMSDKIETANHALDYIDSALQAYPNEAELEASKLAIREFIGSVKVAHWVELAERSAFKGHYRRAIERYQDALFYLNREKVKDDVRAAGMERIGREIEMLRAHLKTAHSNNGSGSANRGR